MLMQANYPGKPIVVIIVEDEPMVRMAAVGAFEDAGFEVFRHAMVDFLPYPHVLYVCRNPGG